MSASSTELRRGRSNMREVAELAGVAMSSVSRVLSGHPDVSPLMRERVLAAVEELGYRPDMLAQSLRRRETMSVGFVVGDISNSLFAEILKGAETTLREAGYSMLFSDSGGDPELDLAHVRLFEQRRADGLILSLVREGQPATVQHLERIETPIVVLDRELPEAAGASRVLSDHRAGMSAAVRHLLALGHRRIGLIVGQPVRPAVERRRALEQVFAEQGLAPTYDVREGTFSAEHGARATAALLDAPEPPTALIAGGNQLMIGSLQVLRERGIALGRELSFVGCDDIAITELFQPPIAVVRRDNELLGRRAAELLLRRMRGEQEPVVELLPTEFVPRASCGQAP